MQTKQNKNLYDLGQRTPFPPYQFIQMGLGNVSPTQETPSEQGTPSFLAQESPHRAGTVLCKQK